MQHQNKIDINKFSISNVYIDKCRFLSVINENDTNLKKTGKHCW